jgi:hypothetical protein
LSKFFSTSYAQRRSRSSLSARQKKIIHTGLDGILIHIAISKEFMYHLFIPFHCVFVYELGNPSQATRSLLP